MTTWFDRLLTPGQIVAPPPPPVQPTPTAAGGVTPFQRALYWIANALKTSSQTSVQNIDLSKLVTVMDGLQGGWALGEPFSNQLVISGAAGGQTLRLGAEAANTRVGDQNYQTRLLGCSVSASAGAATTFTLSALQLGATAGYIHNVVTSGVGPFTIPSLTLLGAFQPRTVPGSFWELDFIPNGGAGNTYLVDYTLVWVPTGFAFGV